MGTREQAVSREELAITLFEESGDALFLFHPNTEAILDVNPVAEQLSGFSCQEMLPMEVTYLFRSVIQGGLNRLRNAYKTTGLFHSQEDFLLRHKKDGVWIVVNLTVTRLHTRAGTLGLITARDISERRRLEEKIIRLAAIVRSSEDAIIGQTLDGIITDWNAGAERLYGYTAEEIIGKHMSILVLPEHEARSRTMMERLRRGEPVPPFEAKYLGKDGQLIPVSVSQSAILNREGQVIGAAAIHRNISERLRLEEEVRQSQKMDAIGQLAGGVAHDFNNLLTIISGHSEILLSMLPAADPQRESLTAIHDAGERAASLTRQLLAFSRQTVLQPRVLELNQVVKETVKMLRRLIGEDILLTAVLDPTISRIRVDPGQLGQVLLNLAVNARDAMPRGGKLTIETHPAELGEDYCALHPHAQPGSYVLAAMTDTGCGMTPEVKSRIFEPFFTTKRVGKGTGLGLATVYGIVKQSGGHIEVYSEVGHGTTFKLYFPAVEEQTSSASKDPAAAQVRHGSETLLVVEDEASVRGLAQLALQTHGYEVLVANDGKDALRVAHMHDGAIDLLVTDVIMPGMSGRELAETLRSPYPNMRVLYVSGYTDDSVVRHGLLHAEVAFLQKPYTPLMLAKKVRGVLDGIE